MEALASTKGRQRVGPLTRRALNQCVRELLLAQSSDWPFIINNGSAAEYATRRVKDHVARFHYLADCIENDAISEEHLFALQQMDDIFPNADYRLFR
jgi:1,4-alpha-glucan branching enzyme